MLDVKMKCSSCEKEVTVGSHNIKKHIMITSDHEHVWMTYFDCPHCSVRNFVQVDNDETNEMVEEESRLMVKALKQKKFGKTLTKKQSEKRKQIERDLAESRKKLMESVKDKVVIDCDTNESYTVSFNVLQ